MQVQKAGLGRTDQSPEVSELDNCGSIRTAMVAGMPDPPPPPPPFGLGIPI